MAEKTSKVRRSVEDRVDAVPSHDDAVEPVARTKKILLELPPDMAEVAATMALREGLSVTKFSEKIVLTEMKRRLVDGYVAEFTKSFEQSAQKVLASEI